MRKLSHQEIVSRQKTKVPEPLLPLSVVLNNIRSLYNVGSIFRTADGAGVEKLWLCGITGYPPRADISKTALGAEESMPWEYNQHAAFVLKQLKEKKYEIVLLEQTAGAIDYNDFKPKGPVCLVMGNEITGVSDDLLSLCDTAIEIEMTGVKNSLNVAVAFGIAAYHIRYGLKTKFKK